MTEFTIGKDVYRAGKMSAMTQFHLLRRLTPCLAQLAGLASAGVKLTFDEEGNVVDVEGALDEVVGPLASALTAMSDEEVDYVFNACLEVTERKQAGGAWAALRVNGTTMFDGLSLPALMAVVYHVVRENLTDFFGELPSLSGLEGLLKAKGLLGSDSPAGKTGS